MVRVALFLSIVLFFAPVALAKNPEKPRNPFLEAARQQEAEEAVFVCNKDFVAFAIITNDRPGFMVIRKKLVNAVVFQPKRTTILLSSSRPPATTVSLHTGKLMSECLGVVPQL